MKILIADKQFVYRDGLKHNLMRVAPETRVIDVESFNQINDVLHQQEDIDLLLADIDILEDNWDSRLSDILKHPNAPRIGVIAAKSAPNDIARAKNIGLCCFLPKNIEAVELTEALGKILQGQSYYPQNINLKTNNSTLNKKLTNRQFEVLRYLAQGLSNKQIAYYMNVSEATVKLHINALLRAIDATNRTQAVIKSQKLGLI